MASTTNIVMNVLIRELSKVCRDHLLDEKWVLAPSLRAGHEWLVAVARAGQPVVNGHVKTLVKLALDLAGPLMAERELELISSQQGSLLVDRVMQRLRKPGDGYLWRLSPSVRLAETVFKAVDALRLAGLDSDDLQVDRFEVDVKGREIQEILSEYVKELDQRNWVDRAGVLRLAIERLRSDGRRSGRATCSCSCPKTSMSRDWRASSSPRCPRNNGFGCMSISRDATPAARGRIVDGRPSAALAAVARGRSSLPRRMVQPASSEQWVK